MIRSPLVSVVIPCYNQAHYLADSLGSVHAQDWPSLESIVVDDGSTDDTSLMARRLNANVVVRQDNRGLSRARNAGLAAASGEYVVFLDADDALFVDAVRSGVAALERQQDASCVARYCCIIDGAGRPVPTSAPVLATGDLYAELLRVNYVWTPGAVVFRREAIASVGGFPVQHQAAADYAVLLSFARRGLMLLDPRDVVWYRKHDRNMSANARVMLDAVLAVLKGERRFLSEQHVPAFDDGQRRWREFYGEQLMTDLRREWRTSRRISKLLEGSLYLWRQCPVQASRHFRRKFLRVLRHLPSTELDQPPPQLPVEPAP
jgi:glycosyltransferase involved in cell wall biosynthesis